MQNPNRASSSCLSKVHRRVMHGRLLHGYFGLMYRNVACRLHRHSTNCFTVRASFHWSLLGSPQQTPCSTRLGRRPPRSSNVPAAQQTTTVELGQQQSYRTPSANGSEVVQASGSLTFQEAIARLQEYWSSVGCAIWQPHNTEVGAGTMNPATFLRVAGPEEWRVCYMEPSVRPDDSRYGENPNRLQQHTQMQVVLKPDPGNPQELYLGSLRALGIDTQRHDVRFVEDNWENPALGAWGLGWEVWMDGQEITQFTYFQQAGGHTLEIPSVEITYGMERIITLLQGVDHFKDIQYNRGARYGEMLMQQEYEMSCFNLDQADIGIHQQLYDLYEREANNLLEKKLPIPAYQHLLKLSHCFNILDARGAIGVTQRARCFATMRQLARQVTELWLLKRAETGHPLGVAQLLPLASAGGPELSQSSAAADLLVEIGCEELPPADVQAACQQLREKVPALLRRLRLGHGDVRVDSTPRRLMVHVADVAGQQLDLTEKLRGPPAKVAFGDDGRPSKALSGFCKKNRVSEADVFVEADAKGVDYVWAVQKQEGLRAAAVLSAELGSLAKDLSFQRSMRWNSSQAFSRPVRWLLGLHGRCLLPWAFGGLQAGRTSRGLRTAGDFSAATPQDYLSHLQRQGIIADWAQRRRLIWDQAQAAARAEGGSIPEGGCSDLLDEVTDLVEAPTVLLGRFEPSFLRLPEEVLVMVMRKHQRYFPVYASDDSLMPAFVTVANGAIDPQLVTSGNEAVLRARFQDALFFYESDLRRTLAECKPDLASITFQADLGSMLDKSERVQRLVPSLAQLAGLQGAAEQAAQAAGLARADLATAMVTEMTALAGIMGRHYAQKEGLQPEVAQAIFESTLPRHAGDAVPSSPAGVLCSVADRLDSLVGLFAAGHALTATADIYGLRRAAYGMLETLLGNGARLDLRQAITATAELQPVPVSQGSRDAVFEFVTRRLEQLLVDSGIAVEVARAILAERSEDPLLARTSAQDLQVEVDRKESGQLATVATILSRPVRLVRGKSASGTVNESLFEGIEERELFAAANAAAAEISPDMSIPEFLKAAVKLEAPINQFFDNVFVMCEDDKVRNNRLALLQQLASLTTGVVDLTILPGY